MKIAKAMKVRLRCGPWPYLHRRGADWSPDTGSPRRQRDGVLGNRHLSALFTTHSVYRQLEAEYNHLTSDEAIEEVSLCH